MIRFPGIDSTEAAVAGTGVAQNHEGKNTFSPTFGLVGALSFRTDSINFIFADYCLNFRKSFTARKFYLQP